MMPIVDEILNELRAHQIELEVRNKELHRTQIALEKTQAHYVDLYDFAPVGYLTLNAEGRIVESNLTGAEQLGMERKDITNLHFGQFIADDYKDLWSGHFLHTKKKSGAHSFELPLRKFKNDAVSYFHLVSQYTDAHGVPPQMRITLTDITQRKQIEGKFHELNHGYSAFLEHTSHYVYFKDVDNRIRFCSDSFAKIFGLDNWQDMVGKHLFELFPEDMAKVYYENEKMVIEKGIPLLDSVEPFYDEAGNNSWVSTSKWPQFDEKGNVIGLFGISRDITAQKAAEEELRIAAAAFQVQESILVTDTRRVILRVNEAYSRMTGYSAEEAVGSPPAILCSGIHDKAFYDEIFDTVAHEGCWQGEIWDKHKSGEMYPVLQTITAVTNEEGQLTHYVYSMVDITAQKKAEKILLDARMHLEMLVSASQEDLDKIKAETAEIYTALNVLLRQRELDRSDAQVALSHEVEATVLPMLKKLKMASSGRHQSTKLIGILEGNLGQLVKFYGRTANLISAYQKLTPIETQVASLIRQGLPTKTIASALNISSGTVSIHRKHIRKKLDLDGKEVNLHSHLRSLAE